ncbi:SDR family NAD(P)-dependent oxidoreductase [Nitrospinota bacterium]
MKLLGRGILITGASRGFGKVIAQACMSEGADVYICGRDSRALFQARDELTSQSRNEQKVMARVADVSRPEEVSSLIEAAIRDLPRFDGLVNNAGVSGPKGLTEEVEWEEWIKAVKVNLMGTVLSCRAAVPHFRRQGYGKIVNLSGGGATNPRPRFSAYAASKAAVVRFTETLAEETRGSGIGVNAVAPGAMNTGMLDEAIEAGPEKVGDASYTRLLEQKKEGGVSPEMGASLCVFLLSSESDSITGRLLSAVWDKWKELPEKRAELAESDIYTLRRIVPEDRGLNW